MDYAALKSYILADAELAQLAGSETDADSPGVPYPHSKDGTILAVMQARVTPVVGSATVEQVFDQLYLSGEYLALKQAQMQGDTDAVMAFAVLSDAKMYGPGKVAMGSPYTLGMFNALKAKNLITQSSIDALIALATSTISAADAWGITSNIEIAIALGRGRPAGIGG